MQITFKPESAVESRLLAALLNNLADAQENESLDEQAPVPPAGVALPVQEATTGKKTRSRKSATTAETPAASSSAETAEVAQADSAPGPETTPSVSSPAEAGNESAPAATEPAASSAEPAGATEVSQDSPSVSAAEGQVVSLDELRVLFGTLTQAGKRGEAVAIVRKYGANGLAEIPEDKRGDVYRELKGL